MLVKTIMTTAVRSARPAAPVRDVAITMCFDRISGLPVVDENNLVTGVISEKDILHAMYPDINEVMDRGRIDFETLETEYNDIITLRVSDIMTRPVITVRDSDPVLKAVSVMCVNRIRRIPVINENGELVGILSMGDVHRAIFQSSIMKESDGRGQKPESRAMNHAVTVKH
ncbi:MAG: CBS domain-containing protein [Gammaproteobacteria bacterium]|nr:CBS domain-containing protein [Gammaproteobacteria bacterium]